MAVGIVPVARTLGLFTRGDTSAVTVYHRVAEPTVVSGGDAPKLGTQHQPAHGFMRQQLHYLLPGPIWNRAFGASMRIGNL